MKKIIQIICLLAIITSCSNPQKTDAAKLGCEFVEKYNQMEGNKRSEENEYVISFYQKQIEVSFFQDNIFTLEEIKGFVSEECGDDAANTFIEAMNTRTSL